MEFEKLLQQGVIKQIITETQRNELLNLLKENEEEKQPHSKTVEEQASCNTTSTAPKEEQIFPDTVVQQTSPVIKILYYIGGIHIFGAMIALMSHTIQHSSYTVILLLGTLYAILYYLTGEFFWKKNEKVPAEILYFIFICSISFIILDIEKMTGFFPHFSDIGKIDNYWELCRFPTIILSVLIIIINSFLQKHRSLSLLAIPTIFCFQNIYLILLQSVMKDNFFKTEILVNSNLIFFIILAAIAFIKDRVTKADYSKWMYFISSIGILFSMLFIFYDYGNSNVSESIVQPKMFILCIIYTIIGTLIQRKSFSILGILGIIDYIMYFEFTHIKHNTLLLTSVIIITGLLILSAGVLCNKNSEKIYNYFENMLPNNVKKLLPKNRNIN